MVTPPISAGALPGITRDSVVTIAADAGIEIRVADLSRSDLYMADEVFLTGTAAEVSAVNSIDDRPLNCPGPKPWPSPRSTPTRCGAGSTGTRPGSSTSMTRPAP